MLALTVSLPLSSRCVGGRFQRPRPAGPAAGGAPASRRPQGVHPLVSCPCRGLWLERSLLRRAWHNWTEEITMADPALPPGFELESPPKRRTLSIVSKGDRVDPPPPPGFELEPTGEVVDGDTIRLTDKRNARLAGFDAWESDQLRSREHTSEL